ncbi:RluA family pseudouridine synthase [Paenibacillus filicis]|uniref:Pseudouridine synthase n=1 Tax=Paenibacillus gyeongsangnamensis TaxID=3388067 RepID=A0ABT4Q970_9BACL|nr:RluA family pseudouridine synthase [Paenibacillus filicis]MCZ8513337.1 RluA family pseudouridine synthase [Paenibacillus filicis]
MKGAGWKRKGEWLEWTLPEELPGPDALRGLPGFTPKFVSKLGREGGIQLQGQRARLRLFPSEPLQYMPEWAEVEVGYEDDFCLVALKPAGMKVHPTEAGETGTLLQAVGWHLESTGQACRPRHIHRLDEDTTGPVLFAKYEWPQIRLDEAMREKQVERIYIALVQGRPRSDRGTVDAPIGRDRHHAVRRRVSPGGDRAVTRYEVLERYRDAALVRLRLETGRTHQIRVHMSHLGHPLLGDALYGGRSEGLSRQALHGERLVFPQPWTGEPVEVEAPLPADLAALLNRLKK